MRCLRWTGLFLLLSCLTSGCGARARAVVEEELTALEADIVRIKDDASAEAFGNKGAALGQKINALSLGDRRKPGERLYQLFDRAEGHYAKLLEAAGKPTMPALEKIIRQRPIIYNSAQPIGPAYH